MADEFEYVARVGLAGWLGEGEDYWDTPTVLGAIGDERYLIEIDERNRDRALSDLIDDHDGGDRSLRIEIVCFGEAGGFFASSLHFLGCWPKSAAELPAEVFVDDHYRAAFTKIGDEIAMTVRHALRRGDGRPMRRFRFHPDAYAQAMSELARESRRLRGDLITVAEQRAPQKVGSLREALKDWPA
jgi:hypothetical protein